MQSVTIMVDTLTIFEKENRSRLQHVTISPPGV